VADPAGVAREGVPAWSELVRRRLYLLILIITIMVWTPWTGATAPRMRCAHRTVSEFGG
jgi:hypothetical protein